MDNIKNYINEHKDRFLNELIELLKIPSVSADSAFANDVRQTADVVMSSLEKAGCDFVEICETDGYPIVYGEKIIDPKSPTSGFADFSKPKLSPVDQAKVDFGAKKEDADKPTYRVIRASF